MGTFFQWDIVCFVFIQIPYNNGYYYYYYLTISILRNMNARIIYANSIYM